MTVLKRRHRSEDSDYNEVEVRVLLMDGGLCLSPSARNGDRDTIPYALADTLEMAREWIEYRFVGSGQGWRNAADGGAPVRFGGEPPLDPGLVERLMDEENLKSGEVDHGEPLYFIAANSQASEVLETSVKAGWLPALPGLVLALKARHLLDMNKAHVDTSSGSTRELRRLLEDAMASRLELWTLLGEQAEEIEKELDLLE